MYEPLSRKAGAAAVQQLNEDALRLGRLPSDIPSMVRRRLRLVLVLDSTFWKGSTITH